MWSLTKPIISWIWVYTVQIWLHQHCIEQSRFYIFHFPKLFQQITSSHVGSATHTIIITADLDGILTQIMILLVAVATNDYRSNSATLFILSAVSVALYNYFKKNCTFWDKENLFTNIFSSNTFSSIIHPFIFLTIFFKFRVAGELKLIPAVFGWKAQGTRAQHISIMTKHSQFIGSFLCFCFVFCYTL